ncbi:UrcA family protein [Sphingopyxis sp. KK2]|uniref:UrcA family protein n=1 Tax=Sphingopyxis sp. KK2 TaxID=1855727 RepID=UPI00097E6FE1|nr:UrcA family protein [Sphingopyxis sp. KK2]
MSKLLILAALAATTLGQPAFAQTAPAAAPRTAVVQHSDLDLRSESGTKTLDRRIWRAVVDVCGTASDFDLAGKNEVRECRRDTRAVAAIEANAVVASATRGEPIRVTSIAK